MKFISKALKVLDFTTSIQTPFAFSKVSMVPFVIMLMALKSIDLLTISWLGGLMPLLFPAICLVLELIVARIISENHFQMVKNYNMAHLKSMLNE